MIKTDLLDMILEKNLVSFRPIKLTSGKRSNLYINWRTLDDAWCTNYMCEQILDHIYTEKLQIDTILGVPEGGTKYAIISQYKLWEQSGKQIDKYTIPIARKTPKKVGDPNDRYMIGKPKGKILVIEDVITTGNSLIRFMDSLNNLGYDAKDALVFTDRLEKSNGSFVSEKMKKKGYNLYSLMTTLDIVPEAYELLKPSEKIAYALEKEFAHIGLKLL